MSTTTSNISEFIVNLSFDQIDKKNTFLVSLILL